MANPPSRYNDQICVHPSDTQFSQTDIDLIASRRLRRWELLAQARALLPDSTRLWECHRKRLPLQARLNDDFDTLAARAKECEHVRVYRRENDSTYYKGLRVCGSVWTCPVCAAKISERRRVKLALSVDTHKAAGGEVALLTLTVPHTHEDEPFSLVRQVLDAYRKFGQGRNRWTSFVPGYLGSVRALEVTYGSNGWHPHLHVLVFLDSSSDLDLTRETLSSLWSAAVQSVGLSAPSALHGVTLHDGSQASQYVGKWGVADELTKAHIKMGRKGGRTPWALLSDSLEGDVQAGRLFVDFTKAFKGRSQLQWSRGLIDELEDRYGIQLRELRSSDELLATETVETSDELAARIPHPDWTIIRRFHLQGQVLQALNKGDYTNVSTLLQPFKEKHDQERISRNDNQLSQRPNVRGHDDRMAGAAPPALSDSTGDSATAW